MPGLRLAALGALALLACSCRGSGPVDAPAGQGTLDLSRVSVVPLAYVDSRPRLAAAGRSPAGLKPAESATFLRDVEQENLKAKPLSSSAPVFLLVRSGELHSPDRFAVTAVTRSGNRLVVEAEERRFGNWSQAPKDLRDKNEVRNEAAVIPLGTLSDGDYEAELIVVRRWFQEFGHPEKAAEPEPPKTRAGKPVGPILCPFTVGKLRAPRLTEVSQLISGGANRIFHANGLVNAGHISGGREAPRVYMEKTWAPRDEIAAIWKVASALDLEALAKRYPEAELKRKVSLHLVLPDGTEREHNFPMGAPELRELEELLGKSGYGAW